MCSANTFYLVTKIILFKINSKVRINFSIGATPSDSGGEKVGSSGDQTQTLTHAQHVFYHFNHIPTPYSYLIFS